MIKTITRNLSLTLVTLVIISTIAGCGPADKTPPKDITDATGAPATAAPETSEGAAISETANIGDSRNELSIDEQILLEQEGLRITTKGFENDSIWGMGVKLLIENNTDKNLGVGCNALIVNNYMISDLFSSSVAAGKKSNEIMYISSTGLSASGIHRIGQIEVYFNIYDSDTYETIFDADLVTIKTSEYDTMDIRAMDDGKELLNRDGIRIVGKYVDEDSFWGTAVLLFIKNSSGKNVGINCDNLSVNGFMVSPVFSSTIYAEKMAIDDITILSSDL